MRLILVVILIALVGGYWYWTTTPQYSMREVKEAIKSHDLNKFNKYVDADSVSSHMVDDFVTDPFRQALGPTMLGQIFVTGMVALVKPHLQNSIKQELYNFVESGNFKKQSDDDDSSKMSLSKVDGHLGFRKHAYKGIAYCKTDGAIAQLELIFHNAQYNADLPLDVKMRKMDGYWQVTQLTNFPEFCQKLAQLQRDHQGDAVPDGQPQTQTAPAI